MSRIRVQKDGEKWRKREKRKRSLLRELPRRLKKSSLECIHVLITFSAEVVVILNLLFMAGTRWILGGGGEREERGRVEGEDEVEERGEKVRRVERREGIKRRSGRERKRWRREGMG